ncbi:MAG: dihydropteroate synthase [Saprospirales bacterium]|nr:dihydropteroate synthase [Saprospirales bacterium]
MGILNITPDSFFPGSRVSGIDGMLERAEGMLRDGATFLDVGGMSSRPGAELVSEEEELQRVLPAVEALHARFPEALISIDTVWASVAREAVEAGACMVNDISAGRLDAAMYETVAALRVPYVLMHMQGTPQHMQEDPQYDDVVVSVLDFLIAELGKLRALGIHDVILDPGFGFGKTVEHNYSLLKNLSAFHILEAPLLVGLSRKSMITRVLDVSPGNALNGTTALHMVALQQGAQILRVHDVKEAAEVVRIFRQLAS